MSKARTVNVWDVCESEQGCYKRYDVFQRGVHAALFSGRTKSLAIIVVPSHNVVELLITTTNVEESGL